VGQGEGPEFKSQDCKKEKKKTTTTKPLCSFPPLTELSKVHGRTGVAQVVEHLPNESKALSLSPRTAKKKRSIKKAS
jgi:hypothetical protein